MSWLESHQELRDHPKTARLRRGLGVSLPAAIGHLHLLWWWALDYAPSGDLSSFDADVIADAGGWEDEAGLFVRALIGAGFLDDDLRIHDWDDYAGRLIDKREANARRKRAARYARRAELADRSATEISAAPTSAYPGRDTGHPADGVPDVARTSGDCPRLPDLTGPNRTGPDRTAPPCPPASQGGAPLTPRTRGARTAMTAKEAFGDETATEESPQGEARRLVLAWARDALLGETRLSWPDFAAELGRADLAAAPDRAVAQWVERARRELDATGELEAARERAASGGDVTGGVTGDDAGAAQQQGESLPRGRAPVAPSSIPPELTPPTDADRALWSEARARLTDGWLEANAEKAAAFEPLGRDPSGWLWIRAPAWAASVASQPQLAACLVNAGDPFGQGCVLVEG